MLDDQFITPTSIEQLALERKVTEILDQLGEPGTDEFNQELLLNRKRHAKYLYGGLGDLPSGFSSLDASRTWICYWVLHGLTLLNQPLPSTPDRASLIAFLSNCQHPSGGFGGGPFQLPHLATTYAAVSALVTLGGPDALEVVDREQLYSFLLRMCVIKEKGGGMTLHEGGEVDVRGCYCALATCHMLGLDKGRLAEECSLSEFVRACQSFEGGIGGEPGNEAHGGYAFCGYAALALADLSSAVDQEQLLQWAARMQGSIEGGFMGRTCKLVDGCYSLWQGGVFPILHQQLLPLCGLNNDVDMLDTDIVQTEPAVATGIKVELSADMKAAAQRLVEELDPESDTVKFVENLPAVPPDAAAEGGIALINQQIESTIETTKASAAGDMTAQHKTAALKRLEQLQEILDVAEEHLNSCENAASAIAQRHLCDDGVDTKAVAGRENPLYDAAALQLWLLGCCQGLRGGLRDKPGKPVDYYHTCYCLSGLSSSQHASGLVLGGKVNKLAKADPLCNVVAEKVEAARAYFLGNNGSDFVFQCQG